MVKPNHDLRTSFQEKNCGQTNKNNNIISIPAVGSLRCRESHQQFQFFWAAGKLNLGNYSTKDHPRYTTQLIGIHMRDNNPPRSLRGCVVTGVSYHTCNHSQ